MKTIILFFTLTLFYNLVALSQNNKTYDEHNRTVDSLLNLLKTAKHDTLKIKNLVTLCGAYLNSDPIKALQFGQQGLHLAVKINSKKRIAICFINIGIVYMYQGIYDKAIEYYLKALKIYEVLNDKKGIATSISNIGLVYYYQNNYNKALEYYFMSLKIIEELGYKKGLAACYNNLGLVFSEHAKHHKNKDSIYFNFNRSLDNYNKSLKITEELDKLHPENNEWKNGMARCYDNIGIIHFLMGNYYKAIEFYQQALTLDEQLNDKNGTITVLINIGGLYFTLSSSDTITLKNKKIYLSIALDYSLKAYKLADEIKVFPLVNSAAGNLKKIYKALDNPVKALEYAEIFISTKNNMFKEEKTKAITEMEVKYQAEKKQKVIVTLTKEKQIQTLALEKNRNFIIFVLIITSLIFILLIVLFRQYKIKQKTSRVLESKNNELEILNKKLVASEIELIKLNSSKDKFFTIISHDLKNPLSAFKSITKFLSSSFYTLSEQDKYAYICELNIASEQLNNLTQNLLQWAISQTGVIKFNPQELDLSILAFKAVTLLKTKTDEKGVNIDLVINENTLVFSDSNMISVVLINLVSNAIKFTEKGGFVTIGSQETNEYIIVSVNDSGIGISPEDMANLFKIETDHKTIGDSLEKGTGLGLILCKEFVEKNGGKLWVESQFGKGSTFSFTIPKNKQ